MEFIGSMLIPAVVTAAILVMGMVISLVVGNLAGRVIRKMFGIGGK